MPARRITLRGRVQGCGVRPAIARLAAEGGLAGSVWNSSLGVVVELLGSEDALLRFRERLPRALPAAAAVDGWEESEIDADAFPPRSGFQIRASDRDGEAAAIVPTDLATCPHCSAEVADPTDRRRGYAFTTCTDCGPRYSILRSMPYDRAATAMSPFAQCPGCQAEYVDPRNRRFHSQTNACAACGPRLCLYQADGRQIAMDDGAIEGAASAIASGRVLGVLGIGGYQLLVDATQPQAVHTLRERKGRDSKPLAILVADLAEARRFATIGPREAETLTSPANPIVVLDRIAGAFTPEQGAALVGPLDTLGVMLPSTALHQQLVTRLGRPLVVTSANREGEPLAFEPPAFPATTHLAFEIAPAEPLTENALEAEQTPVALADLWLDHDRQVLRPIDDSVVRIIAGQATSVRLARGLAPLSLPLSTGQLRAGPLGEQVHFVALGGHQHAAIAVFNGFQAVLGPHVGDLDDERSRQRYLHTIDSLCQLYQVRPSCWVHDLHPGYFSTRLANDRGAARVDEVDASGPLAPPRTFAVQHHHAHTVAAMIERGWTDREVLGVAWDGTGYGTDGTIWGGEFLVATAANFRRVASLRPFWLVGGELAIRQPWRVGVSLVHQAVGSDAATKLRFPGIEPRQVARLVELLDRVPSTATGNTVSDFALTTTSAGRLFDGVAALALGISISDYEAEPTSRLEAACDRRVREDYPLTLDSQPPWLQLDWRPLIRCLVDDIANRLPASIMATRFHRTMARGILTIADRFASLPVVLCGGCFQNRLLTEAVIELAGNREPEIATPGPIPPGDGGLAAGQLAVAIAHWGLAGGPVTARPADVTNRQPV